MRVAILDDYQDAVRHLACFGQLAAHDVTVYRGDATDLDHLADVEALVLIRERTRITQAVLERLPALRLIAQTSATTPHIDLGACTGRGVLVCAGGGSPVSTAELTFGLILAAARNIPQEASALRAGGWQTTLGWELQGKMLGIWGYGKIGGRVAGYGRAFGMDVLATGRAGSRERARADGVSFVDSPDELAERADVLTLHLRLTDETRGLVTAETLARMRPTALLVNTARAGLIEPGALATALAAGRPGAAAVDVFDWEPVRAGDEPLLELPNCLCTPHLGYVSRESYEAYFGRAFAAVNAFADGTPVDMLNPAVLAS